MDDPEKKLSVVPTQLYLISHRTADEVAAARRLAEEAREEAREEALNGY